MSTGYEEVVFAGKMEQMKTVADFIRDKAFLPSETIDQEVTWFYNTLGIDDLYFREETVEVIASHIMSLYGAKILAYTKQSKGLEIELEQETRNGAIYIHNSRPGVSTTKGRQVEQIIDEKYLDAPGAAYRLETYRSRGTTNSASPVQLRCYFINRCDFINPNPDENERDIRKLSDKSFLERATQGTLAIYQMVMDHVLVRTGPVLELIELEDSHEKRLIIGYRRGGTQRYFSALSDLYHYYHLFSSRKYVEQFSNGVTIMSLYLNSAGVAGAPPLEHSIHQVIKEASLLYCLPDTPFGNLFRDCKLSVQETTYAHITWTFCQHFLNRLGGEYQHLNSILDSNNPEHQAALLMIKKRLREDTFTREYIFEIMFRNPEIIKMCYVNFAMKHYINISRQSVLRQSLSYQRMKVEQVLTEDEILHKIKTSVDNEQEYEVFRCMLLFNQHVLKTNFYQPTKVAISFRMNPSFLPSLEYPQKLFGMFFVIGSEFRGFHLRFQDVARGGIRIVRSANREAWSINARNLFDENYNLANTQERKNKDIPEGGAKGTILLNSHSQDRAQIAFIKYVDCLFDLLLVGQTPGIKEKIVDLYGREEILFFGPDEGTADFMNWASQYARTRGYPFWRAFTTGKSPEYGGIPHDTFGMTTRSVHQYVLGICRKLNLKEEDLRKFQTGGPDGDLGSNEIKISKDKTIAIVDGSGVIYDPEGLNREELLRLANSRKMISFFDTSKLSKNGFRVLVDQPKAILPDGTVIERCMDFRNQFHLLPYSSSPLFVPCGGRPEAVNSNNVQKLFTADGKPRFQYVVEGANLFFTQPARILLEGKGVIVFKDASTNKGGVTSSSLEVLAALAFADDEFKENMQIVNGKTPEFYQKYVNEVQSIIEENARLEFECLWAEGERTKTPRSVLSDLLSNSILKMAHDMTKSGFWANESLRKSVLSRAFPQTLLSKLGYDILLKRIPESYLKAIFHSYLSSRFVYKYGTEPSQFAFFEFMSQFINQSVPVPSVPAAATA